LGRERIEPNPRARIERLKSRLGAHVAARLLHCSCTRARGGFATGSVPSGTDAERAGEPSNKSSWEPETFLSDAEGLHDAKPYYADSGWIATRAWMRMVSRNVCLILYLVFAIPTRGRKTRHIAEGGRYPNMLPLINAFLVPGVREKKERRESKARVRDLLPHQQSTTIGLRRNRRWFGE
jgi:hypothetical protein